MTKERPVCLNYGCYELCTHSGSRWRPFCNNCHKASYDKTKTLKEGVTPYKTGKCSNQDGHLGFNCPMDYDKAPWAIGTTEIDHIDGDYYNNYPDNVDELCAICHKQKDKNRGDFKIQNKY